MPEDDFGHIAELFKRHPIREILRIFRSAVHPDDVDPVIELFESEVRPAFEGMPGCTSIELVMDAKVSATGLVEGAVITRWESLDQMEAALATEQAIQSQQNIRRYLRSQPVVTVHLVLA